MEKELEVLRGRLKEVELENKRLIGMCLCGFLFTLCVCVAFCLFFVFVWLFVCSLCSSFCLLFVFIFLLVCVYICCLFVFIFSLVCVYIFCLFVCLFIILFLKTTTIPP